MKNRARRGSLAWHDNHSVEVGDRCAFTCHVNSARLTVVEFAQAAIPRAPPFHWRLLS